MALADLGCAPAEALVVGDDPDADAAGARTVGAPCVLVRTGKLGSRGGALGEGHSGVAAVIDSIADLPSVLSAGLGTPHL